MEWERLGISSRKLEIPVQFSLLSFTQSKGTFNAKMGTITDRNGEDLTEAEEIFKRWQEYTELYKKRS